jgi:hypothetical protein
MNDFMGLSQLIRSVVAMLAIVGYQIHACGRGSMKLPYHRGDLAPMVGRVINDMLQHVPVLLSGWKSGKRLVLDLAMNSAFAKLVQKCTHFAFKRRPSSP